MKTSIKYLFIGFKYLIIQGIVEIFVILILEYLGFKILQDFSKSNLFVENVEGIAWAISMKTAIISLIYLALFIITSNLLKRGKLNSDFIFSIVNFIISAGLLSILSFLKHLNFEDMLPPLISTLLASSIIIVIVSGKLASIRFRGGRYCAKKGV